MDMESDWTYWIPRDWMSHIVFGVKMDFTIKEQFLVIMHMIEAPESVTYSKHCFKI